MNAMPASPALNSELADDACQIAQIKEQAAVLLRGLSDAQYNWRPAAGCWSMAQCVAHVVITDDIYIPVLENCIADARKKEMLGNGPFRHGALGNWFVRS